jgi:hypothetical protein
MKDYLGPDIDAGFRISKYTHPGFVIASHNLAYFLGLHKSTHQIKGKIVGWEDLKGVWDTTPYPIIWIVDNSYSNTEYKEFNLWEPYQNSHVRKWSESPPVELKLLTELNDLFNVLPVSLACKPYLINNQSAHLNIGEMPEDHRQIHAILNAVNKGAGGAIGEPETDEAPTLGQNSADKLNDLSRKLGRELPNK